jgi:Spy/CpxP family protein refolding chaperone
MRGQVMERPRVAARVQLAKKRGLLGLIRIAALLERQSELGLSNDQMQKLLNIRADMIRAKAKITGDIRVARLNLIYSTAMNIGDIDPDQLRSDIKNIYALRIERKAATVDAFKKASDVLTSEQKETLRGLAQERLSELEAQGEADFMEEDD